MIIDTKTIVKDSCFDWQLALSRQWQHAARLLQKQSRQAPGSVLLPVMQGLAASSNWQEALHLQRQSTSAEASCAALVACAAVGLWRLAIALLDEMRGRQLQVQLPAWHAMQGALSRAGRWREACLLLYLPEVDADVTNFLTAVAACEGGGRPGQLLATLPGLRRQALSALLWRQGLASPPSDLPFIGLAVDLLRAHSWRPGNLERLHCCKLQALPSKLLDAEWTPGRCAAKLTADVMRMTLAKPEGTTLK
ncbi:unnamed protein product [Effrenium voratum]|nr:unnamed protein product [Effrenium voratum]